MLLNLNIWTWHHWRSWHNKNYVTFVKNVKLKRSQVFQRWLFENFPSVIHFLYGVLEKMWDVNSVKFYNFFVLLFLVIIEKVGWKTWNVNMLCYYVSYSLGTAYPKTSISLLFIAYWIFAMPWFHPCTWPHWWILSHGLPSWGVLQFVFISSLHHIKKNLPQCIIFSYLPYWWSVMHAHWNCRDTEPKIQIYRFSQS